jgi:hypothetical protein
MHGGPCTIPKTLITHYQLYGRGRPLGKNVCQNIYVNITV